MPIAHSKLTSQGQISVPLDVRRKLGVGPGSVLEWEEEEGRMVVRRAGKFTSEEIHNALFEERKVRPKSLEQLKDGVAEDIRKRHARD